jgi:hypothetical protein
LLLVVAGCKVLLSIVFANSASSSEPLNTSSKATILQAADHHQFSSLHQRERLVGTLQRLLLLFALLRARRSVLMASMLLLVVVRFDSLVKHVDGLFLVLSMAWSSKHQQKVLEYSGVQDWYQIH